MGKTLYEQYLEAMEEYQEKRREAMEEAVDEELYDQLCEQIENEDLRLELDTQTGFYHVTTPEGDTVSDDLPTLEDVADWLEDPKFVFLDDGEVLQ